MGIFQELVTIVNRAPINITGRFDGQEITLVPGENAVPRVTIPFIKNQNPVMGSADADNPNISGAQYLIGVKGRDNCEPLTKDEWEAHCSRPCRIDEEAFFSDRLNQNEHLTVRGKGKKTQAKSAFDAGVRVQAPEQFADGD